MRILRIIASVDPTSGGPIEGLKLSSNVMRDLGHDTEVVSLDSPSAVHVLNFPFKVHAHNSLVRRYGYNPKMVDWIASNAHRFDVAVVHGLWNHASVGGWMALRKAGLPYAVFTHGMMDPWFRDAYPVKQLAKQVFWTLWQGKVLRDARTVLFTSEEERNLARGVFRGHSYHETVVAYGAPEPPPTSLKLTRAFRSLLPQLGDRPYILFLSRIHGKKGCDLLVDAFSEIAPMSTEFDLVVAGPDQIGLKARLQQRAQDAGIAERIHWPGMLSGDAKYGAFYNAEAFILPSHQENFGIVVAEAMACATPVLITDKVNIWREVKACGGGLVQEDTKEGVLNLLKGWLHLSPAERTKMREDAKAGFLANFHADSAGRDLARILERIQNSRLV